MRLADYVHPDRPNFRNAAAAVWNTFRSARTIFGKAQTKKITKTTSTIVIMTGAKTASSVPMKAMMSSRIERTQFETGSGERFAPTRTAALVP